VRYTIDEIERLRHIARAQYSDIALGPPPNEHIPSYVAFNAERLSNNACKRLSWQTSILPTQNERWMSV
jgi:hypothetical protein